MYLKNARLYYLCILLIESSNAELLVAKVDSPEDGTGASHGLLSYGSDL